MRDVWLIAIALASVAAMPVSGATQLAGLDAGLEAAAIIDARFSAPISVVELDWLQTGLGGTVRRVRKVLSLTDKVTGLKVPADNGLVVVDIESVLVAPAGIEHSCFLNLAVVCDPIAETVYLAYGHNADGMPRPVLTEDAWGLMSQSGPVVAFSSRAASMSTNCNIKSLLDHAWLQGLPIIEANGLVVRPVELSWHYPNYISEDGTLIAARDQQERGWLVSSIGFGPAGNDSNRLKSFHKVMDASTCSVKVGFPSQHLK